MIFKRFPPLDILQISDKLFSMKDTTEIVKKQRSHTKTGKLAKRKELRRHQATERQINRIKILEDNLPKAKKKAEAQAKVNHAQLTLQQIRGGVPHEVLDIIKHFVEKC